MCVIDFTSARLCCGEEGLTRDRLRAFPLRRSRALSSPLSNKCQQLRGRRPPLRRLSASLLPVIDWYYTASKLKLGGILVIDDTQLWSCALLVNFLKHDSVWTSVGRIGRRTFAFRKVAPFEYREFCFQPYVVRKSRFSTLATLALSTWDRLIAGCWRRFPRWLRFGA